MTVRVDDALTSLCGWLSDRGCVFHCEASGSTATRYIIVRKPFQAKIRISDHASHKFEKSAARSRTLELNVDASGRGLSWQDAVARLSSIAEGIACK